MMAHYHYLLIRCNTTTKEDDDTLSLSSSSQTQRRQNTQENNKKNQKKGKEFTFKLLLCPLTFGSRFCPLLLHLCFKRFFLASSLKVSSLPSLHIFSSLWFFFLLFCLSVSRRRETQGLKKVENSTLKECGNEKVKRVLHPKCKCKIIKVSSFPSLVFFSFV